jgi:hypothetical protein
MRIGSLGDQMIADGRIVTSGGLETYSGPYFANTVEIGERRCRRDGSTPLGAVVYAVESRDHA